MKSFFVAAMALFILASCSSDDDSHAASPYGNPDPDTVLVKKIVNTFPSGFELTSTYVYDGTKLTGINRTDGSYDEYDYNEMDLPVEMRSYGGSFLTYSKFYAYDESNRLKSYTMLYNMGDCIKTIYTYESNGTITSETFTGNFVEANNYSHSSRYTFENNLIVKIDKTLTGGGTTYTSTTDITYDGKNSFDKNIKGRDIFALADGYGAVSNRTLELTMIDDGINEPFVSGESGFSYTYNEENYPITAVESLAKYDSDYTTNYFYE
jgi:hypothetical protein